VPKTRRKTHTSLTLTQGELEAIDRWGERMGPGTYRNEAVMAAVYQALGESPVSSAPAQRPGYYRQVAHVPGGPNQPKSPGVILRQETGRVVDDSEDFKQ